MSGEHDHDEFINFVTHQELIDAIAEAKLGSFNENLPPQILDLPPDPVEPINPPTDWNFEFQRIDNVNYNNILSLREFGHGGRYLRQHNHLVLTGQTFLNIHRAGLGERFSLIGKFNIWIDNKLRITTKNLGTLAFGWGAEIPFNSTQFSDGWHWIKVVPLESAPNNNPTSIPFPVYIKNTDAPIDNSKIPVWRGTFDIVHGSKPHWWGACVIPGDQEARTAPLSRPMPELPKALRVENGQVIRESEIPEIILTPATASQTILVPRKKGDTHRFQLDKHGILNTGARHGYYLDWIYDKPFMPLLDGPRGQGTITCMTSLEIDSTGGIFGTDGFRIVRVWPDGRVQTRAGWRHVNAVSDEMELVGDWSAVKGPKGFKELWGSTWHEDSLNTNNNLPWVPISDTDLSTKPPHPGPVILFVADTRNNRICKVEFAPDGASTIMGVHDIEPKITEWITGLSNPWKVRFYQGNLYITERTKNRITVYSANEPETYISTVVSGPSQDWFKLDTRQQVRRLSSMSLSESRLYDCFAPEGMVIFEKSPGQVELYWGSYGSLEIKKVNLSTGEISTIWDMEDIFGGNDRFVNFEIAKDSTVTDRGNLLISTWGRCVFLNPKTGVHLSPPYHYWRDPNVDGSQIKQYWIESYPSAACVGSGRFAISMPHEGINIIHSRILTDTRTDLNRYELGEKKYNDAGFKLMHQEGGYSNHILLLPWGVDPDIDFYLEKNNHKKPV